jgi:hypothetical protein
MYVNTKDEDMPGFSAFTRRDGNFRHFYSGEMSGEMAIQAKTQEEHRI